eukprot:Partr_v1_DN27251_c1_g1_i3_m39041 putative TatD DNase domain containing
MIVDCHSHFHPSQDFTQSDIAELENDRGDIQAVIIVSECPSTANVVLKQSRDYPDFYHACIGLHPVQSSPHGQRFVEMADFQLFQEQIISSFPASGVVGIGECGLDHSPHLFHPTASEKDKEEMKQVQRYILKQHIQLAETHGLPLNIHSRHAGHHAIQVLKESQCTKALMHAFDGKAHYALEAAEKYGIYFSCPPSIARETQGSPMTKWARSIRPDRLLIESDAPALAPVKNTRNHPRNCVVALNWLVDNRKDEISARMLLENSEALFPLLARNARPLINEKSNNDQQRH